MKLKFVILLVAAQLLAMISVNAAPLEGRLYTTPAERARLDQLRLTSKPPSGQELQDEQTEGVVVVPVAPPSVSVQGYVKRSDGKKGTVWVNNQPVQENSESGEVRVGKLPRIGNQVRIDIPASGRNVNLKAGQVYMPETDSISEDKARVTSVAQPDESDVGIIGAYPGDSQ